MEHVDREYDEETERCLSNLTWENILNSRVTRLIVVWFLVARFILYMGWHEWGAHYLFVISTLFYIIFTNLGVRSPGVLSAYAVFNPNQQSILGTLTAQELDTQLRGGIAAQNQEQNENQRNSRHISSNNPQLQNLYDEELDQAEAEMIQEAIARSLADSYPRPRRTAGGPG